MKTTQHLKLERRIAASDRLGILFKELNQLNRKIEEGARCAASLRKQFARRYDLGHVYVVEFDSGVLKVGRTGDSDSRLKAHAKAGYFAASYWVSARHLDHRATERRLIAFCAERGVLHGGREYFGEVRFDDAVAFSEVLTEHSVTPEIARAVSDLRLIERRRAYVDFLSLSCEQMHDNFGKTVDQARQSLRTMREGSGGDEDANAREAWEVATGLCDDSDESEDQP